MTLTLDGFGLGALAGLIVGAGGAALVGRSLFRSLAAGWRDEATRRTQVEAAATERGFDETADALREAFRSLSADALDRVDTRLRELSREAAGGQAALGEQMRQLAGASAELSRETSELSRALRSPVARGRWGELQLRRVVELAGMVERCDFVEQLTVAGKLRPDLVVRLPGGRSVIVDAKTPLSAYLEACAAGDEATRRAHLGEHARAVRAHMRQLASKEYFRSLEGTPELVVMFLPGEAFFAAALEADPSLIEAGAVERVILATPTTLIALLRAVAHGWRHEQAAAHAREVAALGRELHDRLRALAGHFAGVHAGLESAMEAYGRAAGVLETRVLAPARRLGELGVATGAPLEALPGAHAPLATFAPGASSSTGTSR
jgi:DNA recombination protein RmuC